MRYRITYFTLLILLIVNIGYSAAITVGFDTATSSGTETNSPAVLTVKLTSSSTGNDTTLTSDVIINYSEGTGSTAKNFPTNYYDFTLSPASLTIPAGVDSANIEIAIQDDSRDESNETIVCELSVPFGLDPGTTSHTYTINDNESAPTVTFATATSTGTEGTLVQLTVNLNQDAGLTVTVPWSFQSGSSTAVSADLTPTSGSLSFVEGESSHTIDFTPVDDTIDELEETVYIQFSAPTNASFGAITGHQVTIADADDSPEIAFSATTSTQNESAGSVTLYIELNTPSGLETSVNYSISGTAIGGGIDHNLGSGTATIAAGDGSTTLTFNIINDALDEDNETIILSLSSPNNSTVGGNDTHTITITDNDTEPFIYFDNPTGDGGEGSTPVNIAVSLSTVSGRDVSVNYSVNGGTATGSGTDYTFTDGTLTFSAGQTSKNISLIVINDDIDEPDETVIIILSDPPTNATLGTNDGFTYTINDNDTEPTIGFTAASSTKAESAGTVTVQITLTAQSGNDISVDYFISSGTATGSGTDYSITEGTATITSGNLTSTFNVTIIDDELDENSETIIIGLQNEVNVTLGGNDTHTMSITDNDDSPTVAFASASSGNSEAANPAQLTVNLSRSSGLAVSVGYSVTGGTTATGSGTDYTLANGTLNYSVGDSTETIDITIVNDALDENTEYIEVTLASPSNATLGGTTTHTYSLTDDDPKPSVGFTTTAASGAESASPTITAQLSAVSGLDITVDYAVTGGTATGSATDYTFQDDTFTITAGDQTATAEITIVDDDSDEDNETIIIQLSNPSSTTALNTNAQTITYTILDNDDAPNISFSLGASSQNENAGSVSLTVSLSAASGRDVSFDYAVTGGTATGSGTDYTFTAGSKTITAGQTTTTIPITITDDTIDENSETVIITLSNATNGAITGNITHTLTITDNDATPTISFNQLSKSSPESTTNPTIGLTITAASGLDISVDYTVTDGTAIGGGVDFTLDAGTISISAGNTTASISPAIIDDDSDEDDETFTVTLSSGSESNVSLPAAGNRTHTFTITDNDDPPTDFTVGTITTVGEQTFTGYWNSTNTAFTVRVPVANNADLEGGSIQVIAKNSTSSYFPLGSFKTILNGELGDSATVTISEAQFAEHAAYGEAKVITISANITDQYGNVTQGTASSTTLTIDTTDPTAFQVSTLTVVGDPVISGYWNSYNTSLNAIVPIENDPTLIAGTIVLQGQVGGTSGDWTSLGSQQPIGAGQVNTNITISPTRVQLEAIASFDNTGARLYISATITDRAGNSTQATSSSTQIIIDEDSPSVTSVASNASSIETVYFNAGDQIQIHIVTDEPIVKSVGGTPLINLNSGTSVNASYSSGQGTTTQVFTYTVAADQNTVDLDYTSVNALSLGGATLKDSAGNDLTLTLASPSDVGSLGGDYDLVIDTQSPEGYISFDNNPVNAETNTNLTVDFSESMATASAYILFASGSTIETTSLVQGGELTWGLFVDVPPGNDGYATITITGEDLAGNSITNALTFGRDILRIDNTQPTITLLSPGNGEYVNHSLVGYRLSETSFSGFVRWTRISGTSDPNSPHNSSLIASELEGLNTFSDYTLTNDPNNLVSGTTYSMTWSATDSAGNISDNFISTPVYYDTTAPTGILTYSHYYASEDTVVTITATFNERILLTTPKISVNFQGTGGDVSNINMAMGADSTIWTYDVLTPPGVGNNGFANVGITATDLAQNSLRVSDLQNTDTLFVDNTVPTATITYSDSLVKEGDNVIVTVEFSEEMIGPPQIGIIYAGGSELDTTNLLSVSSTVWEKQITIPGGNDGAATVSIIANDIAGNLLINENTDNRSLLRIDNTPPIFTLLSPDSNSYVNHTQVSYRLSETSYSGYIQWERISGPGTTETVQLSASELEGLNTFTDYSLTNGPNNLVTGTTYRLIWSATDSAGNISNDFTSSPVYYDTTAPTGSLTYSHYFASEDTVVTITATFNEPMDLFPQITIDYQPGTVSDITEDMNIGVDSTEWTYSATIPGGAINGIALIAIDATDLAQNSLRVSDLSNTDTLMIDNVGPTVVFTYTNLTQPTLTNRGKSGDIIEITAEFDEPANTTNQPQLNVQYADSTNDSFINLPAFGSSNGDSVWIFQFELPDSSPNDGFMFISLFAKDLAGNPVENYANEQDFDVDNTPPAAFITGDILPIGGNPVQNWINNTTEQLQIIVPVQIASNDPTMIGGRIAIEMFNLRTAFITVIADSTSITSGGTNVVFKNVSDITGSSLGLITGDEFQTLAILYDRVGNETIGDTSTVVFGFDTLAPIFTTIIIDPVPPDTIQSIDSIRSNWAGAYEEQNPQIESGIEYYEYAIGTDVTQDTTGFIIWQNNGSSAILDTIYPLEHQVNYRVYVRAYDVAGNVSDIILIEPTITRLNTLPLITQIPNIVWYEDSSFVDSVEITDPDFNTLLGDVVTFTSTTERLYGDAALSSMTIDSETRVLSWVPTQADTGTYQIKIIATDMNDLVDSIQVNFRVEPVNDAPELSILSPDNLKEFEEDKLSSDSILVNLSQYATDVDDSLHLLSWQIVILPDTSSYPSFPANNIIIGPGTPRIMRNYLHNTYSKRYKTFMNQDVKQTNKMFTRLDLVDSLHVETFEQDDSTWAIIYADSNYYTLADRSIIFYATDVEGLFDTSFVKIRITPENDPPVWSIIGDQIINENDSLKIDLTEFVTDVDDSLLTFKITGLTNSDKMTIPITQFSSTTHGDSLFFIPEKLWSDTARIQVIAYDRDYPNLPYKSDTTEFTIDVLFVPRPAISMWVVQNNAFSNFYKIFITDSARKTTSLVLKVQSDNVALDTVGAYTYVGNHSFVGAGTYAFNVVATGIVGETDTTSSVGLTVARMNRTWSGKSSDGIFGLQGKPGSVGFDQSFMVLDSSMFDPSFYDRASYLIGNEAMSFEDPVLISFKTEAKDIAIYRRDIGISWQELPSMACDGGVVSAYSDRMGYYRLGPKTIFVPNETDLGNNYPNPFNPYTNIEFDIGFMDGPRQKANISVFNIRGQQIATLYNNYIGIGRHTIRWDSKDDRGTNVASGIYFVRLSTSSGINKTHKVLLVR
ncbi:MAG: T9SS type A sorting domain-containing protein [Candidatus Marinimicrobia bacterium]|nr:T9SS type A sorting domain-containing protein [Candidatus Neomarinimicrobiota bacterium]